MFLLASSFVLLGSVHYKLVVKKINGLISELLFCFQFWSSGAPFLPSSRTACGQCSPDCGCCWPLSSSRRGRLFSVSTSSVAVSRVAPPVSPRSSSAHPALAFQRSKHVGGERAESPRQSLQRVRVGSEAGRHAGGPGDGRLLLPGEQDGDADPAVLLLLHPADELQQPTGNSLPICLPTIPVRPSLCVRTWSATAAAALSAATAAKKSAGQLCLDQGSEWC